MKISFSFFVIFKVEKGKLSDTNIHFTLSLIMTRRIKEGLKKTCLKKIFKHNEYFNNNIIIKWLNKEDTTYIIFMYGNISVIFLDQIDTKISHVYRKRR